MMLPRQQRTRACVQFLQDSQTAKVVFVVYDALLPVTHLHSQGQLVVIVDWDGLPPRNQSSEDPLCCVLVSLLLFPQPSLSCWLIPESGGETVGGEPLCLANLSLVKFAELSAFRCVRRC